ncbi:FecR family protein [Desertivirga arenae]|uniref:FecR family protein n=1 Tax=Desertivirga arenae TaxID=2810309 RepID=UPI001A97C9ED|nr:FecR family protein [Pedobacter sp. SYSU D00823]
MNRKEFIELARKVESRQATDEEIRVYNNWFNSFQQQSPSIAPLGRERVEGLLLTINKEIGIAKKLRVKRRRWLAAASILLVCVTGLSLFHFIIHDESRRLANDIPSGKFAATLTLANGSKIDLSKIIKGEVYDSGAIRITKNPEGQLSYEVLADRENLGKGTHTLSTALGESVRIVLADGTHVWLNAGSQLKFPANFKKFPSRIVELSGEAYFEVAKDKEHPFLVRSAEQEIKVLGTHFNVSSYPRERQVATLVEGSIAIGRGGIEKLLHPGQEAVSSENGLAVRRADTTLAIAWKNSMIMFERESIVNIMKKISRWYNVEVEYKGEPVLETYTGAIPRDRNIAEVLKMLEKSGGVEFKVDGRRITVQEGSSFF